MIKIIHSADWHLSSALSSGGSAVKRALQAAQERFIANLAETIRTENVQILLLAGDIFDSPEAEPHWLQLLQNFCRELADTKIFIAPGNHDPYFSEGIWTDKNWPDNVHLFSANFESICYQEEGLKLRISGKAFPRFLCETSLIDTKEAPDLSEEADYDILLLHGELVSSNQASNYNPIDLNDARYEAYDYLALGHIHLAQKSVNKNIEANYPGTPQARGFDESGRPSYCLGQIDRQGTGPLHVSWEKRLVEDAMLFIKMDIDITNCPSSSELAEFCWKAMLKAWALSQDEMKSACWRLTLTGTKREELQVATDYLGTQLGHKGAFYLRIYDQSQPALALEQLKEQSGFSGLIYRNYERALPKIKKSDLIQRKRLEKALHYALSAHENRLELEGILRRMDRYQEYEAEVRKS